MKIGKRTFYAKMNRIGILVVYIKIFYVSLIKNNYVLS
jgi:hypothetical protein